MLADGIIPFAWFQRSYGIGHVALGESQHLSGSPNHSVGYRSGINAQIKYVKRWRPISCPAMLDKSWHRKILHKTESSQPRYHGAFTSLCGRKAGKITDSGSGSHEDGHPPVAQLWPATMTRYYETSTWGNGKTHRACGWYSNDGHWTARGSAMGLQPNRCYLNMFLRISRPAISGDGDILSLPINCFLRYFWSCCCNQTKMGCLSYSSHFISINPLNFELCATVIVFVTKTCDNHAVQYVLTVHIIV